MLKDIQQAACANRFKRRCAERQKRLGSLSSMMTGAVVDPAAIEPAARQMERARLLTRAGPLPPDTDLSDGRRIFEAVLGRDDRLPRSFLSVGSRICDAVCRIATSTETGEISLGTGFAVARGLILTNNHVLPDASAAARGQVEFGFWSDALDGQRSRVAIALDPERFFLTDMRLDFTLVSLEQRTSAAVHEIFGAIDLLPQSGKALVGEAVNAVQHGGGGAQTVSLRDNIVVDVFDDWLHYTSDTDEGASGAPVLNDQWQLAALHHAAFEYTAADGSRVVVNEGARISSITRELARRLG